MKVTLDKLYKVEDGTKMKGSASVIIDDCFKITGIKIFEGNNTHVSNMLYAACRSFPGK